MVRLSERVTLQTKAYIPDEYGGFSTNWAIRGHYWAEVKLLSFGKKHRDIQECGKKVEKPCFLLTLRKQVPLKGNMRVKWRGDFYQLISYPIIEPKSEWVKAVLQPIGAS